MTTVVVSQNSAKLHSLYGHDNAACVAAADTRAGQLLSRALSDEVVPVRLLPLQWGKFLLTGGKRRSFSFATQ